MKLRSIRLPRELRLPRALAPADLRRLPRRETDLLVIGSGLAGLRAALEARRHVPRVTVLAKGAAFQSNTAAAQGGIAAAFSRDDSVEAHVRDTLDVGAGLVEERIARIAISEGLDGVRELVDWGVPFDRERGRIALGREGGHSLARVLHRGDETGLAISHSLLELARRRGIRLEERTFLIDLLVDQGRCVGALCRERSGRVAAILARRTILASGGAGQVFRETTNPPLATGDGIAAAFRAGAALMDLEFVQFHPTVLYLAGAERVLISEAVRGEGAALRDRRGEAFMRRLHPMGDLAPRDVVSRAIVRRMAKTGDTQAYLDVRMFDRRGLRRRFPGLAAVCARFGLDPKRDLLPVRPAAHYFIGGVMTDEFGRTTLPGLYAAGECAAAGFHGANRLASNSLLECLVFGRRAGLHAGVEAAGERRVDASPRSIRREGARGPRAKRNGLDVEDMRNSLRSLMWRHAGVERTRRGLEEALESASLWSRVLADSGFEGPEGWELQNLFTVGAGVLCAALARAESRGVHYRSDRPKPDPALAGLHLTLGM
jgi:L-aspartate oxidase